MIEEEEAGGGEEAVPEEMEGTSLRRCRRDLRDFTSC